MEELKAIATEYWQELTQQLMQPETGLQLLLIAFLFLPAWLMGRKAEPLLEQQARKIKDSPGLLRLIIAFLRRLEWFFFALLLAIAYSITSLGIWPPPTMSKEPFSGPTVWAVVDEETVRRVEISRTAVRMRMVTSVGT